MSVLITFTLQAIPALLNEGGECDGAAANARVPR